MIENTRVLVDLLILNPFYMTGFSTQVWRYHRYVHMLGRTLSLYAVVELFMHLARSHFKGIIVYIFSMRQHLFQQKLLGGS